MAAQTTAAPLTQAHPSQEIQKAKTTSAMAEATRKAADVEHRSADKYYATGDAVYTKIKGTRKWTIRVDKVWKARQLRKIYYQAAAHIDEAARLFEVAVFQEQQMLAENKAGAGGNDFDPTK